MNEETTPTNSETSSESRQPDEARESSSLESLSKRLDHLAEQLEAARNDPDEAARLVKEASSLSAEAGREVEAALRDASETRPEQ